MFQGSVGIFLETYPIKKHVWVNGFLFPGGICDPFWDFHLFEHWIVFQKLFSRGGFRKVKSLSSRVPLGRWFCNALGDKFCRTCEACFFFLEILKAVVIMVNSETLKKELISRETGRVVAWLFSSRTLGFYDPIWRSQSVQMGSNQLGNT